MLKICCKRQQVIFKPRIFDIFGYYHTSVPLEKVLTKCYNDYDGL